MKLSKALIREFRRPGAPIEDLWIPPKIDINNLPKIDDPYAAIKAIRTAQDTCIIKAGVKDGQPYTLPSWQWDVEWRMFGLRDPDGLRTIRDVSIIIPKKNAKSPWMHRLALYFAGWDDEPGAEIAIVANSSEQANNIYRPLLYSVENHPGLKERFTPFYVNIEKTGGILPASIREPGLHKASRAEAGAPYLWMKYQNGRGKKGGTCGARTQPGQDAREDTR